MLLDLRQAVGVAIASFRLGSTSFAVAVLLHPILKLTVLQIIRPPSPLLPPVADSTVARG